MAIDIAKLKEELLKNRAEAERYSPKAKEVMVTRHKAEADEFIAKAKVVHERQALLQHTLRIVSTTDGIDTVEQAKMIAQDELNHLREEGKTFDVLFKWS